MMTNKENVCVVCFRNIDIYAVGNCDHYDRVCYVCSARLRVLCQKNDCPICRQDLPEVIFSEHKIPYNVLSKSTYPMDNKYKIKFENEAVQEKYEYLLQQNCRLCPQPFVLKSFGELKNHLRKNHEVFFCELCVEHLKLFTFERKFYNRSDLAQHRRIGDPDNTSHRGHPRCQFCDQRYLDKDELYRHLRREHFFCHFCEADGYFEFYGDYNFLRAHFQDKHYLCEEDDCKVEKFTTVFRSDIDLKAHVAQHHSKNFTKQQAKQARTLELEFTIAPRQNYTGTQANPYFEGNDRRGGGRRNRGREGGRDGGREGGRDGGRDSRPQHFGNDLSHEPDRPSRNTEEYYPELLGPEINTRCEKEFPTLSGQPDRKYEGAATNVKTTKDGKKITIQATAPRSSYRRTYSVSNESDFPSLEPSSNSTAKVTVTSTNHQSNAVTFRINNNNSNNQETAASKLQTSNVSIKVSSKATNRNAAEHQDDSGWSFTKFIPPKNLEDEFPTLVEKPVRNSCMTRITIPVSGANSAAWGSSKKENTGKAKSTNKEQKMEKTAAKTSHTPVKPINTEYEVVKTKSQKKKANKNNNPMVVLKKDPKEKSKISKKGNANDESEFNLYNNNGSSNDSKSDSEPEINHLNDENKFFALGKVGSDEAVVEKSKSQQQPPENHRKPIVKLVAEDFPPLIDNFPALSLNSKQVAPPGFNKRTIMPAKKDPPPGFATNIGTINQPSVSISLSSVALQLTEPAASLPKKAAPSFSNEKKYSNFTYQTPDSFEGRNRLLIQEIFDMLGDNQDNFKEFKRLSGMFRQGSISAKEYYEQCLIVFGRDKFHRVLVELLVLLPDIPKQQELLSVHNDNCKRESRDSGTVPKNSVFMVCATCQQVLLNKDFRSHMTTCH